jgi:hypothetical protein
MAAARIAILALLVSIAARAQSPSKIALKVTDPTGAPVSHARIQARTSESKITAEIESDAQGEAVLPLDPGTSIISVRASGFDRWEYKVDRTEALESPLIAVLRIRSYYGPTLVNFEPLPAFNTEPQPPIKASIPLEPLAYLKTLPKHKLSHHDSIRLGKD